MEYYGRPQVAPTKSNTIAQTNFYREVLIMSKGMKVFLILFVSVFTAGVAANIICEIFKTRLQKYYSVD